MTPPPGGLTPDEIAARDTLVALGDTRILRESWTPDGTGVVSDGIVGGDGAGEAVSVRYLNRYLPQARITVAFYVVDARERGLVTGFTDAAPFHVEAMVEFFLADRALDDANAQERWCDYRYRHHGQFFATEGEAEVERDRLAEADLADYAARYRWDGVPS